MTQRAKPKKIITATAVIVAVVAIVVLVGYLILRPKEKIIEGLVEVNECEVTCKVPGRILEIRVKDGDYVKQGDTLAILDALEVKSVQAQSESGREEVSAAFEVLQQTKAGLDIAVKSYNHMKQLAEEGVVGEQKREEAYANYKAMEAQVKAAQSQYDMALNGARRVVVVATRDGEVSEIFPEVGELVGNGSPIADISQMSDLWATFNVHEGQLDELTIGNTIHAFVPAFNKELDFKVFYIKDLGCCASPKTEKPNAQNNLKTFEVKARPVGKLEGLRPGMAVVIKN